MSRLKRKARRWLSISTAAAMASSSLLQNLGYGAAAPVTWTGSSSSNFETPGNWNGGAIPLNDITNSVAVFGGTVGTQPSLTISRSLNGLSFTTATGGWDLQGTGFTLSLGGGGISSTNTSGTNTLDTKIALLLNQTWTMSGGGTLLANNVISGSNNLTVAGAGALTFAGSNTYSGTTTISAGSTLNLGVGGNKGSLGTGAVTNSGLLVFNRSDSAYNYASTISGTGSLTVNGGGTLTLSSTNTYTGATNINNGTLVIGSASPGASTLGNTAITVGSASQNGTLSIVGSSAIAGTVTLQAGDGSTTGQGTLNMNDGLIGVLTLSKISGTTLTLGGASGTSNLKFDVGSVADSIVLSGSAGASVLGTGNQITVVGAGGLYGQQQTLIFAPGGGLDFSKFALATSGNFNGWTVSLGGDANHIYLIETGGTAAPTTAYWKGGIDSNWNTYNAGATNFVTDPTSGIDTTQTPGATTNVFFSASGATNTATTLGTAFTINSLNFASAATVSGNQLFINAASGYLDASSTSYAAGTGIVVQTAGGSPTINSAVILGANQTWTIANSASTLTVNGNVSGTYAISKTGSGTVILAGSNTFTGGVTITGGALQAAGSSTPSSALGTGTVAINGGTLVVNSSLAGALPTLVIGASGATIKMLGGQTGSSDSVATNALSGTGTITIQDLSTGSRFTIGNTTETGFSGKWIIDGQGSPNYTQIGTDAAFGVSPSSFTADAVTLINNGALYNNIGGTILGSATRGFTIGSGGGIFFEGTATSTIAGQISSTGTDTVTFMSNTTGTVILTNPSNSYSGNTQIEPTASIGNVSVTGASAFVLKLGASNVIPDGPGKGDVFIPSTAGNLDLNGQTETINGLWGAGNVDSRTATGLSSFTVGNNNATSSFSGVIKNTAGTVALTKIGGGTLTLSGASTYIGATAINNGTVALTGTASLGATAITVGTASQIATLQITGNHTLGTTAGGTVTVTGGNGSTTGGVLSLQDGALNTLTLANLAGGNILTLGNGSVLAFDVNTSTADAITLGSGGAVSLGGGSVTINLSAINTPTSNETLITAPGGFGGASIGSWVLNSSGGNFGGSTLSLAYASSNTILQLQVSPGAATPSAAYWSGAVSSTWNTFTGGNANNSNWLNGPSGSDTHALPGSTTDVYFTANTATNVSTTLGQNFTINSLTFTSNATSPVTIANNTLTLAAAAATYAAGIGIVVQSGSAAHTISSNIVLGNATTTIEVDNVSANALTLSGVVSGTNLMKTGVGTLALTGTNTYTGTTSITGGTLAISQDLALGPVPASVAPGSVVLNGGNLKATSTLILSANRGVTLGASGGTVTAANPVLTNFTISGVITGSGGLTVASGTGTFNPGGINTYSGGTTLLAGALTVPSVSTTITSGTVVSGAYGTGMLTLAGGSIRTSVAANVTLANTLAISADTTFGTSPTSTGSTFALVLTGAGTLTNGSRTLSVPTFALGGSSAILSGSIGDAGSGYGITKSGGGNLTLSGSNTFSGGVTLSQGTLILGNAAALGTSAGTFTISGGSLDVVGAQALNTNNPGNWTGDFSFVGSNNLNLGTGAVALGGSRTVNVAVNTLTVGGAISGSGFGLTKIGGGTLALTASNAFTGGVTLSVGTLNIGNATALGSGTFTINGGAFNNTSGGATTLSNNIAQSWNGNFTFVGSNSLNLGAGAVTLNANAIITGTAATLTVGGAISGGTFGLTKLGAGILALNGSNSFSGGFTLASGTLNVGNANALGSGTISFLGTTAFDNTSGSPISLANNNAQVWNGSITYNGAGQSFNFGNGAVSMTGNTTITMLGSTVSVGGNISDAGSGFSLTKTNAGALVLGGSNSYGGGTTVSNGVLALNNAYAIGSGTFYIGTTAATASLDNTAGGTISLATNNAQVWNQPFSFSGTAGNLDLGTGSVTITGSGAAPRTITVGANTLSIGGIIPGTIGLTKAGGGTLNLYGASTYTGATNVNAGTLLLAGSLGATDVSVATGATLLASGNGSSTALIGNTNAASGGTVTVTGGATVPTRGTLSLVDNNIGSLTILGNNAGTSGTYLTLASTGGTSANVNLEFNATQVDTITVDGAVSIGGSAVINLSSIGGAALTPGQSYTLMNYQSITGTFTLGTASFGSDLFTLTQNPTSLVLNVGGGYSGNAYYTGAADSTGAWSNTGNFTTDAAGATALPSPLSASTSVFLTANSASNLSTTVDAPVAINALVFTGTSTTAGSGSVSVTGSTLTINATNGLTDSIGNSYAAGTGLVVQSGSAAHTISAPVALGARQTWEIDNAVANALTVSGAVSGTFGITKTGTGALTLSGSNAYTGGVTLSAGRLNVNNGYALGTGMFTIGAGTTFDNGSAATITLLNNNAQTWAGDFTFVGTKSLNLGTGAITMTASTNINVPTSGATLNAAGVINGGTFAITKSGAGFLTLNASNTFSGGVTLAAGILNINSNNSLGSGTLTVTGVSTLENLSGSVLTIPNAMIWSADFAYNATAHSMQSNGAVLLKGGNRTFTNLSTFGFTQAGAISDAGSGYGLTLGGGLLVLSGSNSYSGGTTLAAGTMTLSNQYALGTGAFTINGGVLDSGTSNLTLATNNAVTWGGNFTFAGSQNLTFAGGGVSFSGNRTVGVTANTLTVTGSLSGGTFGLTKTGNGTLQLLASNTYSGTTISAGTLQLAQNGSLGTGAVVNNANLNNARSTGSYTINTMSGSGSFTQSGTGTSILSAANSYTYTGGTNVTAGTLLVNGSTSATGTVAVSNAATILAGTGTIGGAVTAAARTVISAGDGATTTGKLTINGATNLVAGDNSGINSATTGSIYLWKINNASGAAGTSNGWDTLALNTLSVSGSGTVTVEPLAPGGTINNFNASNNYTWAIATVTSGAFNLSQFALDTATLNTLAAAQSGSPSPNGFMFTLALNGSQELDVVYSPSAAPEPTSLMLMGLGTGGLLMRRRRRKLPGAAI